MRKAFVLACALLATPAAAADWILAPDSSLKFAGIQTGAPFSGRFERFSAQISLDPDKLDQAKIAVEVDIASAATGDKQRDEAMPGKDWFDVAQFPKARFVSTAVRKTDKGFEAEGELSLRGVSKPVKIPFSLTIAGDAAEARGHVDLRRDLFGVGQGEWATGDWVALEVAVDFDLKARRAD